MRRRSRDQRLARLRDLTGVRRQADLIDLGRIAEEVVERPPGERVLADWLGRAYAVGIVSGTVVQAQGHSVRTAGDVFLTTPYERVDSLGAIVIVAAPAHAAKLSLLLARGGRARGSRQEVTPAMSSSAAAYGSS